MADQRSRAQLSLFTNVAVGGCGGVIETYMQMPLITWKYCIQEGRNYPNTIPTWWRGGMVQSMSLAPITAFQVMTNGILETMVTGGVRDITPMESLSTALTAGALSAWIYGPADLIVIQQQNLKMTAMETVQFLRLRYGNFFFTRGMLSTAGREAAYACGYLGLAPIMFVTAKKYIPNEPLAMITAGIFAGSIGSILSHPVDTGKTVMQADITRRKYPTAISVMRAYSKMYGFTSLYKGGFARVLRSINACFIIAGIRETAIRYETTQEFGR